MIDGTNIPLTEPVIIPCVFVSAVSVLASDGIFRFVGWVEMPPLGGEVEERRIVVRFVMTREATRIFRDDLAKLLKRPGH